MTTLLNRQRPPVFCPGCGHEAVVRGLDQALQAYKMTGATVWQPLFLLVKTRSLARGGKTAEALETITTALRLASDMGSYWWEAELFRFKGEMLLAVAGTNAPEAQACFERALVIARQQSARSLELRTCMSRARLARSQGQEGPIADLAAADSVTTEHLAEALQYRFVERSG